MREWNERLAVQKKLGGCMCFWTALSISTERKKQQRELHTMCDCGPLTRATFLMGPNNRPLWDFYTALFDTERCDFSADVIHSRHMV